MANELSSFKIWTFSQEIEIPDVIFQYLVEGEEALYAYKTIRDVAVFTNMRLIVRDSQGITGKKVESFSVPFSSINMYSTENSGTFDFNSEVELWTRAGHIKINLKRGIDIRKLDRILASSILK